MQKIIQCVWINGKRKKENARSGLNVQNVGDVCVFVCVFLQTLWGPKIID